MGRVCEGADGSRRAAWYRLTDRCYRTLMMALHLNPNNAEAKDEAAKLRGVMQLLAMAQRKHHKHNHNEPLDVVIVGAGASGVGVALMLTRVFGLDAGRILLVERGGAVGETFRRWPREMRFISPSFNHQVSERNGGAPPPN